MLKVLVTGNLATEVNTLQDPVKPGLYLAFTDPLAGVRTKRSIFVYQSQLIWINGKWGYPGSDQNFRGKVYAWLGPLPHVSVEASND